MYTSVRKSNTIVLMRGNCVIIVTISPLWCVICTYDHTGPFTLSKWLPGDVIEPARNDGYWGDTAEWDNIIVRPIGDGTTRSAALIAGDVDFIERVAPADLPNLESKEGISVFKSVSNRLLYITLHMTDDRIRPYVTDNEGNNIALLFSAIKSSIALSISADPSSAAGCVNNILYSVVLSTLKSDLIPRIPLSGALVSE